MEKKKKNSAFVKCHGTAHIMPFNSAPQHGSDQYLLLFYIQYLVGHNDFLRSGKNIQQI